MLGMGVWVRVKNWDFGNADPHALAEWARSVGAGHVLVAPAPDGSQEQTDALEWLKDTEAAVAFTAARVRLLVGVPCGHPDTVTGHTADLTRQAFEGGADGVVLLLDGDPAEWIGEPRPGEAASLIASRLLSSRPRHASEPIAKGAYVLGAYAPRLTLGMIPTLAAFARTLDVLFVDGEWTRWPDGNHGDYGIAHRAACAALLREAPGANLAPVGPAKGYPWPGLDLTEDGIKAFLEMGLDGQAFAWCDPDWGGGNLLEVMLRKRHQAMESLRRIPVDSKASGSINLHESGPPTSRSPQ